MKSQLAHMLGRLGLAPAMLAARRLATSPWLTVLSYHRAGEVGAPTDYDDGVIDVDPDAFERKLVFLKRWCTVVDNEQMLGFVAGARLPKNPIHITFDDGYRDNHDIVMPLLQRHGLKATFFVSTSYIENRRLFWWDRINLLVKSSRQPALHLTYPRALDLPLDADPTRRGASIRVLTRIVKDHFGLDLERFLDHVAAAADVSISPEDERRRADELVMTWDHVRALRRGGMDVQSHTRTHRVLQTLSREHLADELAGSKKQLEDVLEERVRSVSYPVGKPIRSTPYIRDAVAAAGYDLGFSNCSGVNHAWRIDPLDARRVPADASQSDAAFAAMIAIPYLGART